MTVNRIKAAPGAGLALIATDKFKSGNFSLNFYIPLERETAAEVSLLSRVMMRGTERHPDIGSLNRYTDMLYNLSFGASVSANGSMQIFSLTLDFLDDRFVPKAENMDILASAMNFVCEFFCEPLLVNGSFSPEYTEAERKLLLDRIRGEINNKNAYAFKRCRRLMLGEHPAAISPEGEIETVSAVKAEALYPRLLSILRGCHCEAMYAGNVTERTEKLILDTLRRILPADRADVPLPERVPFVPEGEARRVTEEATARQGRLILGYSFPYDGTESAVAAIFNDIFGGSPMSRLFMNVRERLSLCYYCSSVPDVAVGALWVRSGLAEENLPLAEEEIARQLADIASGNVSEEELAVAKLSLIGSMKTLMDSPAALGDWYLRRYSLGLSADPERMIDEAERVSAADVSEMAGRVRLCLGYYLRGTEL